MKIRWILVPIILAGVLCSERLRPQTPLDASSLEIAGSDEIRSSSIMFFYLTVWFQREPCEALLVVTITRHDFSFHGEVS
jgi:hypothetical protein